MDFELQIEHRITEIDSNDWDHLIVDRPLLSRRWLQFGETILADSTPTYFVLRLKGQPIAGASLWLTALEPIPVWSKLQRCLFQAILKRWPLLTCRTALGNASALILPTEPNLRASALTALTKAGQELMRQNRAVGLIFDYLDRPSLQWMGWPNTMRQMTVGEPGTRLSITWPNFEIYLQQLSSSSRKDYRRHRNRATDMGITVVADQEPPPADTALVLMRNVEAHHETLPNPWNAAIICNAGLIDGIWLRAMINDRLVGCGLLAGEKGSWFLTALGLDYSAQYVYFELMHAAIQRAIEVGAHELRGGSGAYEFKAHLGFRLEDNNNLRYVVGLKWLNWITRNWT